MTKKQPVNASAGDLSRLMGYSEDPHGEAMSGSIYAKQATSNVSYIISPWLTLQLCVSWVYNDKRIARLRAYFARV